MASFLVIGLAFFSLHRVYGQPRHWPQEPDILGFGPEYGDELDSISCDFAYSLAPKQADLGEQHQEHYVAYFESGSIHTEPPSIKLPKEYQSADGKLDSDIFHSANQRKNVVIGCFQILILLTCRVLRRSGTIMPGFKFRRPL